MMYKRLLCGSNFDVEGDKGIEMIDKLIDFGSEQTNRCGLLKKKLDLDSSFIFRFKAGRIGDVFPGNVYFRNSMVITNKLLEKIKGSVVFPKHQNFPSLVRFRKNEVAATLFYFYIDYITFLDFKNSVFQTFKQQINQDPYARNIVESIVDHSISFTDLEAFQRFRLLQYKKISSEKLRIRPIRIVFEKHVYDCDILPSNYLSRWTLVSDRFAEMVAETKNIEFFDTSLPIILTK